MEQIIGCGVPLYVVSTVCVPVVCLQAVIGDRGVDPGVRWMAITYMKNGVDRYWRKDAPRWVGRATPGDGP